jgi:hypothetical protein
MPRVHLGNHQGNGGLMTDTDGDVIPDLPSGSR